MENSNTNNIEIQVIAHYLERNTDFSPTSNCINNRSTYFY